MIRCDGGATSQTLLRRAADWRDLPAWHEMFQRYDPLLRDWCRKVLSDESEVAEVSQRVWIELADRMKTFRYDPTRSFRGWLARLCRSRLIDFLRLRKREKRNVDEVGVEWDEVMERVAAVGPHHDGVADDGRSSLLGEAELAQASVRSCVEPRTWEVYWRIAIEEKSIKEVAVEMGMTYTGAFAAFSRVDRKLRDEGERRLAELRSVRA